MAAVVRASSCCRSGPASAGSRGAVAAGSAQETESPEDEALFEALREWRRAESLAGSVPAFVVASDRALRDIVALRPRTRDDLLSCYGIGPQKAARYGDAILEVIARH